MFNLFVNQVHFLKLPYKFANTQKENNEIKYKAIVELDGRQIKMPELWSNLIFYSNIKDKFEGFDP